MSQIKNNQLYETLWEQVCEEADDYEWENQSNEEKENWIVKEVRRRFEESHD